MNERDREAVQGLFPAHCPSRPAFAGPVERAGGQVEALQRAVTVFRRTDGHRAGLPHRGTRRRARLQRVGKTGQSRGIERVGKTSVVSRARKTTSDRRPGCGWKGDQATTGTTWQSEPTAL